jgi:hypothetical protein
MGVARDYGKQLAVKSLEGQKFYYEGEMNVKKFKIYMSGLLSTKEQDDSVDGVVTALANTRLG